MLPEHKILDLSICLYIYTRDEVQDYKYGNSCKVKQLKHVS